MIKNKVPKYKYYINSEYGEQELNFPPDGWSNKFKVNRKEHYHGIFRQYAPETLFFIEDGYNYLEYLMPITGINSKIYFRVEELQDDWSYAEVFNGKILTRSLKFNEKTCEAQILDNSDLALLWDRIDLIVDLMRSTTMSGASLTAVTDTVTLPEQDFQLFGSYSMPFESKDLAGTYILGWDLISSSYNESQSPNPSGAGSEKAFFKESLVVQDINVAGGVNFEIPTGYLTSLQIRIYTDSTPVQEEVSPIFYAVGTWAFNEDFSLQIGDSIYMEIIVGGTLDPSEDFLVAITGGSMNISGTGVTYPEIDVKGISVKNAFERCVKITTDLPFTSTFLDSNPMFLTNGVNIRGGIKNVSVSLKQLYDTISAIYNVGLGYESGTVVLEELSHFYDNTETIDLTDRITRGDFSIEFDTRFFNQVEIGFEKYIFEYTNGLTEFNTKTTYSTLTEFDKKRTYIAPMRADTIGIVKLRANVFSAEPDENVEGDDDIFIIACADATYLAKTDEGYDIYPQGWYNLDFSPARVARRLQLQDWLRGTNLTMEKKEKTPAIVSQETGGVVIDENANVPSTEMEAKIFTGELIKVDTYMTRAEIESLDYKQKVKVFGSIYGYIKEFTYDYENDKITDLILFKAV